MYNADTELLFPSRVIPLLANMKGAAWRDLIDRVENAPSDSPEHLAFVLLMVRLGGCVSCNADSFRAMRGCSQCARQTIRRFRGADQELIGQYEQARQEVSVYLQKQSEPEK